MELKGWSLNSEGYFKKNGFVIGSYWDSPKFFVVLPDRSRLKKSYTTLLGAIKKAENLMEEASGN